MYGDWVPIPDPDRPTCPYFPGFAANIEPHTPPKPFGSPSRWPKESQPRAAAAGQWLWDNPQSKAVVNYPPWKTTPDNPRTSSVNSHLKILKSVSIGNARGPQLVLCSITPSDGPKTGVSYTAMTKIYDGLYYRYCSLLTRRPQDVCLKADEHYSIESKAYEELEAAGLTGNFNPEYYGSYTFSLPLRVEGVEHMRPVRLILVEYIDGLNLEQMYADNSPVPDQPPNADLYPEDFRLRVMAKILEALPKMERASIRSDPSKISPQNIMLANSDPFNKIIGRVVILGFTNVTLSRYSRYAPYFKEAPLPVNPMVIWKKIVPAQLDQWGPEIVFCGTRKVAREPRVRWLKETFGGEKAVEYQPVADEEMQDSEDERCL